MIKQICLLTIFSSMLSMSAFTEETSQVIKQNNPEEAELACGCKERKKDSQKEDFLLTISEEIQEKELEEASS